MPELEAAVDLVMDASRHPSGADVWGEEGGSGSNLLDLLNRSNLAAMPNPKGEGVIVSVVYSGDRAPALTAYRTGWLALDDRLYPINGEAAAAFRLRWAGYPPVIRVRAGLPHDDYFDFDAYGIDEHISYDSSNERELEEAILFLQAANARCEKATGLGAE